MNDLVTASVAAADTSQQQQITLTQSLKRLLDSPAERDYSSPSKLNISESVSYLSVYEIADTLNMSVEEWVHKDPDAAVRTVEHTMATWYNVLTMASIQGAIGLTDENGISRMYAVNKNQVDLIKLRFDALEKQYKLVKNIAKSIARKGEKKSDVLGRILIDKAIEGDIRTAAYIYDRVEGRPAETRVVEADYDYTYAVWAILKTLFDKQLEVLNSGNGVKLICCSRRAGKTRLLVAMLMIECLRNKNVTCMYIGETMELSENLVNSAANEIIEECQLKDKRGRRLDWKKFDNGSQILIRGLSNTKDPDQIRGFKARVIVIDEFFHLKSELLEYLQREVLTPMQMDYADDYMFVCAGTPPRSKGTFGEYCWRNWEVPKFVWTWRDNPHPVDIESRRQFVENDLKDKGLDWNCSFARREYNGEWAYDDDLLLYPEYHTYDKTEAIPTIMPTRILFGIDYGVGDNDTIWGAVWNDSEKRGYQFYEVKFNRLDILDKHISQLEYLGNCILDAWRTAFDYFKGMSMKEANKVILWDADDSDQHLTDYFNSELTLKDENGSRLKLNIQNAHKTDKAIMFDKIRDLLRKGDMLIMKDSKCENELQSTILKRGPNGEVYKEVDNVAFHPDLLPPMRYALWNAIGL